MDSESPYVRALPKDNDILPRFWPYTGFRNELPERPFKWRDGQEDTKMNIFQLIIVMSLMPFKGLGPIDRGRSRL